MDNNFNAGLFHNRFYSLQGDLIDLYREYNLNELADKLKNKITDITANDLIRIVFVGQFSSGKSSIIKALTGDSSIKIGTDVTTTESTNYQWGNFLLTDTPGLQNNQIHDDIAEEAIKVSDLIVYCITSELFSKNTLEDFKRLAFEKNYKGKIILLVNKINNEYTDDIDGLLETYKSQINKDLTPHTIDEFEYCFADLKDYVEGIIYNDEEQINDSRFLNFIKFLNSFLEKNGLLMKISSPIMAVKEIISESFINCAESEDDRARRTALARLSRTVDLRKSKASREWDTIVNNEVYNFIHQGFDLSNRIGEENFDFSVEHQKIFEDCGSKLSNRLDDFTSECIESLSVELDEVFESNLGQYLVSYISMNIDKFESIEIKNNNTDNVRNVINQVANAGAKGIEKISFDTMKVIVKNVGHKVFKVKFKPWGVTKVAKNITKFSKGLPIAGDLIGIALDVADTLSENKEAIRLNTYRSEAREYVKQCAEEMRTAYNDEKYAFINEVFKAASSNIENIQNTIIIDSQVNFAFNQRLNEIENSFNLLLDDVMSYKTLEG